jgi:hypothetical protein
VWDLEEEKMGYARRIGKEFRGHAVKRLGEWGNGLFAIIGK